MSLLKICQNSEKINSSINVRVAQQFSTIKWNNLIAGPTYVLFVPELAKFLRLVTLGMFQVFQ